MKFSKFVKSLAPDGGAIYERTNAGLLPRLYLCLFPMISAA